VVNPDQTDSDGTADNQICGVSIEPHGDACAPPAEGQVKSVLANVCDQNESVTFTPPARLPALGPIPQVCLPDAVGGGRCGRAGVIGARCTLPYECVAGGPSCSVRDPVINPASSLLVLERGVGNPRWQISAASLGLTSAFGLDGTLYVGSLNGRLYALGTNGSVKWSVQTGGPIVSSPLVDIGGMLYVGSDDGKLYAIDTSTGRVTFTTSTGGAVKSSPALDSQGRLYVGSDANALLAIGG
jgi:hypothetical protein